MKLFEINESSEVQLNKVWIMLIPEFALLLKRDKGSPGDTQARYKLKARKEFTFIYFYTDFNSPLRDWSDGERLRESLIYAGLSKDDLDEEVLDAVKKYEELAMGAARSMRTYRSLLKMLDAMDLYLEKLDFTKVTKTGELVNSPDKVSTTVQKMDKMYESVKSFEKRVQEELKDGGTGIRGTAVKGENEDKVRNWSENDIRQNSLNVKSGDKATELGAGGPSVSAPVFSSLISLISGADADIVQDEIEEDDNEE